MFPYCDHEITSFTDVHIICTLFNLQYLLHRTQGRASTTSPNRAKHRKTTLGACCAATPCPQRSLPHQPVEDKRGRDNPSHHSTIHPLPHLCLYPKANNPHPTVVSTHQMANQVNMRVNSTRLSLCGRLETPRPEIANSI